MPAKKKESISDFIERTLENKIKKHLARKIDSQLLKSHSQTIANSRKSVEARHKNQMTKKFEADMKETEINEISKQLLGAYVLKARQDGQEAAFKAGKESKKTQSEPFQSALAIARKRAKGIKKAVLRLASDDVEDQIRKMVKKGLKEDAVTGAPTNSMGSSSSTAGTGPIDTFDPLLGIAKKKLLRRKLPLTKVADKQ
jgi:hypothetical protein